MGRWLSDVEECKLLMQKPNVKEPLDIIEKWYDEKQKREQEAHFTPALMTQEG